MTVAGGAVSGDAGVVLGAGLADVLLLAAGDDVVLVERGADGVSVEVPGNLDRSRRSGRVNLTGAAADVLPGARETALVHADPVRGRGRRRGVGLWTPLWSTPRCASSSPGPSPPSRRSSTTAPTCWWPRSAVATVWDAARAAREGGDQFRLIAAAAAALAFGAYVRNAELNIQVHGGIGFTWGTTPTCICVAR